METTIRPEEAAKVLADEISEDGGGWLFATTREERDLIVKALRAYGSDGPKSVSPTEESVRKFKVWTERCCRDIHSGDSKIACDAQIRILRQLLEYLGGDEYLALHVEDAVKRIPATGILQGEKT